MRVLDLFAGCGGFSLGFRQAGFEIARAVENHRPVADAYAANFPEVDLVREDIQKLRFERGSFDIVIGGPPCEPFTVANAKRRPAPLDRLYKDKIGGLVLHFIRIVGEVRPRAFVMENVPEVAEGELRAALEKEFVRSGFPKVHFNHLLAEEHLTPSHRRRLFISNLEIAPPPSKRIITVGEALAGLPPPGSGGLENHSPHPLASAKRRRVASLRPGGSLYRYSGGNGATHANWTRLRADLPAPTVKGSSRFIDPNEDRHLTVREHARLMGFPDDFVFLGGRDMQYDEVGEAVPPPLARAIAGVVSSSVPL